MPHKFQRYLIVSEFFYPKESGCEKIARLSSLDLLERGYNVDIITRSDCKVEYLSKISDQSHDENYISKLLLSNISYTLVNIVKHLGFINGPINRLLSIFPIMYNIKKKKPEIILVHGYNSLLLYTAIIAKMYFIPCYIIMCTSDIWDLKRTNRFRFHMIRLSSVLSCGFIAKGMPKEEIIKAFKTRKNNIYQLVNPVFYRKEKSRQQLESANIDELSHDFRSNFTNCFVIGLFGKISRTKNPLFLIEIMRLLPNKFKLLIIGNGPLEDMLKEKIKQNYLLDRIIVKESQSDLLPFFKLIDLYLFPTTLEPALSQSMLESMLNRVPVLVRETKGMNRWFMDNEEIIYFKSFDPNEVCRKILYYSNQPLKLASIASRAFEKVYSHFAVEDFNKEMLSIINHEK